MKNLQQKAFLIAFGDFASRGLSFITSIYLARTLGTEYYGLIVIAISVLGYCFWFSDLGLVSIAIRETAKEPDKRQFYPREIFNLRLFLAVVVLSVSMIVIRNLGFSDFDKQIILKYLYSVIPYALMLEWYFNGRQRFGKVALAKTVNGLVYALLVFILIKKPADIETVPWLYISGSAAAALVLGVSAFKQNVFERLSRGFETYKRLLKSSSIIGIGWFFTQMGQLLPPILIGIFLSVSQAGLFGAAHRVIILVMLLDRVFINLLLPNLAAMWSENPEYVKTRTAMVLKIIISGGILLSALVAVNAETLISILYGAEYGDSSVILKYLSLFILLTFMNSLFSFGLLAIGNDRDYLVSNIYGGTISAVLIILFSIFGSAAAVAGSVTLSEAVMMAFAWARFNKVIPSKFIKTVFIIGIPTAIYVLLMSRLQVHFVWGTLGCILVVGIFSRLSGAISMRELKWLRSTWL